MPVNEKILFRSFQYLFSPIYNLRYLSSAMLRENHAVYLGKKYRFPRGGGINIRLRPKYRPLGGPVGICTLRSLPSKVVSNVVCEMSDFVPRVPKLCEDPWIGEPCMQRRQHWEVTRELVFEPASSEVRALLRRMRRAAGWRPHRQMEIAAARYDALTLLYMLVDQEQWSC
jgi:hypothetical protein